MASAINADNLTQKAIIRPRAGSRIAPVSLVDGNRINLTHEETLNDFPCGVAVRLRQPIRHEVNQWGSDHLPQQAKTQRLLLSFQRTSW